MDLTDLRIFIEPQQGASYDDILGVAAAAERLGFGAFFRSDHYLKMGDVTGLPGPSDAWTTLAGLARDTSNIRLGTLVTSATFRAARDRSPSRSPASTRCRAVGSSSGSAPAGTRPSTPRTASRSPTSARGSTDSRSSWRSSPGCGARRTGETYSFDGDALRRSPTRPRSRSRSRRAARRSSSVARDRRAHRRWPREYASEFNFAFAPVEAFTEQRDRVVAACETIDRDPATMMWSTAVVRVLRRSTRPSVVRRAAAIGRDPDELRRNGGGRDDRRDCGDAPAMDRRRRRPDLPSDPRPRRPRAPRRPRDRGARLTDPM